MRISAPPLGSPYKLVSTINLFCRPTSVVGHPYGY
jgi:hypothetical protein